MPFSKLKAYLRKAAERKIPGLRRRIIFSSAEVLALVFARIGRHLHRARNRIFAQVIAQV
jgi:hypothetical protein